METSSAIKLIRGGVDTTVTRQVWFDLGAGSGTFTTALSEMLDEESKIHTIDRDEQSLKKIKQPDHGAKIIIHQWDFMKDDLIKDKVNGILMANSLHFVEDQVSFLSKIRNTLLPNGRMVIVEYDQRNPNPWVPFPIAFNLLKKLAIQAGFSSVARLGELPSAYNNGMMYGALLN